MKRCLFAIPLLALIAVGTWVGPAVSQGDKKTSAFQSDLFPLRVGGKWIYQGADPKDKIAVTVERMEPVKRRVQGPTGDRIDSIETYVLKISAGDKSLQEQVLVTEDGIYRFAAAGKEINPPLKILKLPPAKGDSWSVDSMSENVALKGQFVVDQETVVLPKLGAVQTWVSRTKDFSLGDQKMEAAYWFAPGLGIVKQHVKVGKFEMRTTLEDYRPTGGGVDPIPTIPGLPPIPPAPK